METLGVQRNGIKVSRLIIISNVLICDYVFRNILKLHNGFFKFFYVYIYNIHAKHITIL